MLLTLPWKRLGSTARIFAAILGPKRCEPLTYL
jgi:hypothetical protein